MTSGEVGQRDLVTLVVDSLGAVVETDVIWEPYRLVDPGGGVVASVTQFLHELQAGGRSPSTQRSYALDLLRWFRFLWAVEVPWGQATRCEARDFCRWLALVDKPRRGSAPQLPAGVSNAVTGKRSPGRKYATSTLAHSETVLRSFYAFHCEVGSGPIMNPFPLVRERAGSRAGSRTSGSTRSSLNCAQTGTGRWSRSGSRPGRGPPSCWGRTAGISIQGSS